MLLVEHAREGYVQCNVLREDADGRRLVEGDVCGTREQWWIDGSENLTGVYQSAVGNSASPEDLLDLADYSYASMLQALRLRHARHEPYTWIGPVLVSVNPCAKLESFSGSMMQRYLGPQPSLTPHPFAVVNRALQFMEGDQYQCNSITSSQGGSSSSSSSRSCHRQASAARGASRRGSVGQCSNGPAAVLVTGESGAGKTETVKAMLSFLVARRGARSSRVCDVLVGSTQALEAFGNARTLQNGNSSRFGRLTEVWLDSATGQAEGAAVVPYMLEASRVTHHARGELSFHIFYSLGEALRAASPVEKNDGKMAASAQAADGQFWGKPGLWPVWQALADLAHKARYSESPYLVPVPEISGDGMAQVGATSGAVAGATTAKASSLLPPARDGHVPLEDVAGSMRAAGLQDDQILAAMQLVVAVAVLGNIQADALTEEGVREAAASKHSQVAASLAAAAEKDGDAGHVLGAVAGLLSIDQKELRDFLVARHMHPGTTGSLRGSQSLVRPRTAREALTLRDSAAREIYTAVFVWLVRHVRQGSVEGALTSGDAAQGSAAVGRQVFAVLDIYGFEVCETNGLEQLLINYCNERLQALFNAQMFAAEARDYEAEGLEPDIWMPLCKVRDLPALQLLEGEDGERFPTKQGSPRLPGPGLFSIVDDEARCRFNEGSETALRSRMDLVLKKERPGYKAGRCATRFAVAHFAGDVTHESRHFVETNAQAVRQEIITFLMAATKSSFLREVLETRLDMNEVSGREPLSPQPVGSVQGTNLEERLAAAPTPLSNSSFNDSVDTSGSTTVVHPCSARRRALQQLIHGGGASGEASKPSQQGAQRRVQQLFGRTVIQAFRSELDKLINSLQRDGTHCHYVRCLKPNAELRPLVFDGERVLRQCRYSGLLETVQIRQHGYPHRRPFAAFVQRYAAVCWPVRLAERWGLQLPLCLHDLPEEELAMWARDMTSMASGRAACDMSGDHTRGPEIVMGRTKILMRPAALARLEASTAQMEVCVAVPLQAMVRRGLQRMKFMLKRWVAARLQATFRGQITRRAVAVLRSIFAQAAGAIQRHFRGYCVRVRMQRLQRQRQEQHRQQLQQQLLQQQLLLQQQQLQQQQQQQQ